MSDKFKFEEYLTLDDIVEAERKIPTAEARLKHYVSLIKARLELDKSYYGWN